MATKNFVIFGQGRSGSNLLRSLLNSHPDIFCENELFNPNRVAKINFLKRWSIRLFPMSYIFSEIKHSEKSIYGFKLFVWHHSKSEIIIKKLNKQGWKILHIQRKNTLKQAFSGIIAEINNVYVKTKKNDLPSDVFNIPPDKVKAAIENRKKFSIKEQEILTKVPHLKIVYEEHLQNEILLQNTADEIFQLLGINSCPVIAKTEITDPRPDWERIKNFEEIIRFLNETGYSKVVEDYYKYL